jgi:hypothetical protein
MILFDFTRHDHKSFKMIIVIFIQIV